MGTAPSCREQLLAESSSSLAVNGTRRNILWSVRLAFTCCKPNAAQYPKALSVVVKTTKAAPARSGHVCDCQSHGLGSQASCPTRIERPCSDFLLRAHLCACSLFRNCDMVLAAGTIQGEASNAAGQAGKKAPVAETKGRSPDRLLFCFFHLRMVLPSLVRLIASRLSVTVLSGRKLSGS